MWHCDKCYHVYHHSCITRWATQDFSERWTCPTCKGGKLGEPRATCWCRKKRFPVITAVTDAAVNSCSLNCQRLVWCEFGRAHVCQRTCHPGPHQFRKCSKKCAEEDADPGIELWQIIFCTVLTAGVFAGMCFFILNHIQWWTQPYRYPQFARHHHKPEAYWGMILIISAEIIFCTIGLTPGVLLWKLPQGTELWRRNHRRRRTCRRSWASLAFLVAIVMILAVPTT